MNIFNLFPLTVLSKIYLEDEERKILINEINKMKHQDDKEKTSSYAWTGDTNGHEFLFSNNLLKTSQINIICHN